MEPRRAARRSRRRSPRAHRGLSPIRQAGLALVVAADEAIDGGAYDRARDRGYPEEPQWLDRPPAAEDGNAGALPDLDPLVRDAALRAGLQVTPDNATLWYATGLALVRAHRPAEALSALKKATELAPGNRRFAEVFELAQKDLVH